MKFIVSPELFEYYPDLHIGLVIAIDLDNRGENTELQGLLQEAQAQAREQFGGGSVREDPRVVVWREAYRRFGAKPKKYPSSIENLLRRVVKGEPLRAINKLVDLYNVVSLRRVLPLGGEDLDRMRGDLLLTVAGEGEAEVVLLGEKEARAPRPGEVIYRDDEGAICRRFNWKEAFRTRLTEDTRRAVLVSEALPPAGREQLEEALADLEEGILRFCGGRITTTILDRHNRTAAIGAPEDPGKNV